MARFIRSCTRFVLGSYCLKLTFVSKIIKLFKNQETIAYVFFCMGRLKFYCVDVNKVPQALVKRGNITLKKEGEMKAEVIGGHKAWLVIEEVKEMIQKCV
ncbi:hypothetical protein Leryth_027298 [Lithospermum erythrorhizon]|nr:hypothetical protein Leryth_027298 [Lithospermum erythrorhizon]